jgi:uncharacterized membrane protein
MAIFHAANKLDRAFEISLLLKAIDGLFETLSGITFLFIHPGFILRVAHGIVGYHPHNFIAMHFLKWATDFGKGAAIFAALYLLSHGLIKLVLIYAIIREQLWAYLGLIIVTVAFVIYQLYHLVAHGPSFSYIALTLFDFVVIYLTSKEYGRQKVHFAKHDKAKLETE